MRFAAVAVIALFAGYLGAQTTQTTETTKTTTVNLNGTLIDQGCATTHMQHKESTTDPTGASSTTETNRVETQCPVTTTTTSFGLITPEGRIVRFDDSGNTRVVEMVKNNKDWKEYVEGRKPVRVHVVGTPNGDVVVIKEIK